MKESPVCQCLLACAIALVLIPEPGWCQPEGQTDEAPAVSIGTGATRTVRDRSDEAQTVEDRVMDAAVKRSEKADQQWLNKAADLVDKYGEGDGILQQAELRRYLNDRAFRRFDTDSDDRLLFEEFAAAYLHCSPPGNAEVVWKCSDSIDDKLDSFEDEVAEASRAAAARRATEVAAARLENPQNRVQGEADAEKPAAVDADYLTTRKHLWWFRSLEEQLSVHWDRLCAEPCEPRKAEVARYLWKESLRRKRPHPDERRARIEELVAGALAEGESVGDDTSVERPELDGFLWSELFNRADGDGNKQLDVLELKSVFDYSRIAAEFAMASGSDFLLSEDELLSVPSGLPNSDLRFFLEQHADERKELLTGTAPTTIGLLADAFVTEERDALEGERKKSLKKARGHWVPNRGLVWGQRVKSKIDFGKPVVSLRLIKKFTKAGSKALPANVTWDKERGGDEAFSVDAALRFDFYFPKWYDKSSWSCRPAAGTQINRSGAGDKKKRVDRYFLLGELFLHHGEGFLGSSTFQIGPVIEKDRIKNVEKLLGLVEWEPFLRFGRFTTGIRHPLAGDRRYTIFLRPKLAVEVGEIRDQPPEGTLEDLTFFLWEAEVGLRLGRLDATYTFLQRHDVDDFDSQHQVQEGVLKWRLDDRGIVSLSSSWKKGEDSPTFELKETFKAGISIKI